MVVKGSVMDGNAEVFSSLKEFSQQAILDKQPPGEIPVPLEHLLLKVAHTGQTNYPWEDIRLLLSSKLDSMLVEFVRGSPISSTRSPSPSSKRSHQIEAVFSPGPDSPLKDEQTVVPPGEEPVTDLPAVESEVESPVSIATVDTPTLTSEKGLGEPKKLLTGLMEALTNQLGKKEETSVSAGLLISKIGGQCEKDAEGTANVAESSSGAGAALSSQEITAGSESKPPPEGEKDDESRGSTLSGTSLSKGDKATTSDTKTENSSEKDGSSDGGKGACRSVGGEEENMDCSDHQSGAGPAPGGLSEEHDGLRKNIQESLLSFKGAPFTIQRLCELVTSPKKHYSDVAKLLRGIQKIVSVVTTVDPYGRKQSSGPRSAAAAAEVIISNGLDGSIGAASSLPASLSPFNRTPLHQRLPLATEQDNRDVPGPSSAAVRGSMDGQIPMNGSEAICVNDVSIIAPCVKTPDSSEASLVVTKDTGGAAMPGNAAVSSNSATTSPGKPSSFVLDDSMELSPPVSSRLFDSKAPCENVSEGNVSVSSEEGGESIENSMPSTSKTAGDGSSTVRAEAMDTVIGYSNPESTSNRTTTETTVNNRTPKPYDSISSATSDGDSNAREDPTSKVEEPSSTDFKSTTSITPPDSSLKSNEGNSASSSDSNAIGESETCDTLGPAEGTVIAPRVGSNADDGQLLSSTEGKPDNGEAACVADASIPAGQSTKEDGLLADGSLEQSKPLVEYETSSYSSPSLATDRRFMDERKDTTDSFVQPTVSPSNCSSSGAALSPEKSLAPFQNEPDTQSEAPTQCDVPVESEIVSESEDVSESAVVSESEKVSSSTASRPADYETTKELTAADDAQIKGLSEFKACDSVATVTGVETGDDGAAVKTRKRPVDSDDEDNDNDATSIDGGGDGSTPQKKACMRASPSPQTGTG